MKMLCTIRDIYRSIAEFENRFQTQYALGLNEAMLLCSLSEVNQSTSGEIAEMLGLSQSNTSKIIRSVEKKNLIERKLGIKDKRQMIFMLSNEGVKTLKTIKCNSIEIPEILNRVITINQ